MDSTRLQTPRTQRLAPWRRLLVCVAVVCAVGLYSVEATHVHRTAADDLRCPVCHVAGHSALDNYQPDTAVAADFNGWYAAAAIPSNTVQVQRPSQFKPRTRAPPASA